MFRQSAFLTTENPCLTYCKAWADFLSVQNLLSCYSLFHNVISDITVMRLTVDRNITMEG